MPWPDGTKLPLAGPFRDLLARGVHAPLAKFGIEAGASATSAVNLPDLICNIGQGEGVARRLLANAHDDPLRSRETAKENAR